MSPSASKLKKKAKARFSRSRPEPDGSEVSPRVEGGIKPLDPGSHARGSEHNLIDSDPAQPLHESRDKNATSENSSDLKPTISATVKLVLCIVRDSADAFPPLKSVAGAICSILENYERAQENKQAIESLAPRIKSLAEALCAPVSEGDTGEELRRKRLEQKLEVAHQSLTLQVKQRKVEAFLNNVGNADKLGGLLEDIRDAMVDYQTSSQQDIYDKSCRLIEASERALLNEMHHVAGARYRSGNRQGCLRGTRKDVLWQIDSWLVDERVQRVFWLNGLAGTGKSTIAQTFAETSFSDGKLGASFFCSRDFEDRSNIRNIFPTLAFQLAYRYPQFRKELLPVLKANPEIGQDSLCSQLETLIIGPLKTIPISTLIVIDAIDECKDEEPASAILSVLSRYIDQIPGVKFFVTGRPEPRIRTGFRLKPLRPITEVLKLHEVEPTSVDADIKLFFETRLGEIAKARSNCDFTENWPNPYDIGILCRKAAGLFIYASTVVKSVASPHHLPTERLTLIISLRHSTAHEGKSGIDLLYTQVLDQAFQDVDSDEQELFSHFKLVVGAVLLVFHPLSRKTLSKLLSNCGTPSQISNALRSLHSLLLVPTSKAEPIRTFHKSFPDFITDPRRCKDERFFVNPSIHHTDILFSCLNLMKERLRKNICDLEGYPALGKVEDLPTRTKTCIGSALEYACRFWTKHLANVPSDGPHVERVRGAIDEFFTAHLLFWIEVLSLTGNLNLSVYALHDIDQWCLSTGVSCKWTADSQRLILLNFDEIRHSPTKIYRYILPFYPSSSWFHDWYPAGSLQEVEVIMGRPEQWGVCSRVVSLDHFPQALACWKDMVAVGSSSGDIFVLDAVTGSRKSVFARHKKRVTSLAFSLDGTLLVSGSRDDAIKLWDIQTGGVVKTFLCRGRRVYSVSISPDAGNIAAGSQDNAICLWDVRTGKGPSIIKIAPQPGIVTSVDFHPAIPGRLVSVSANGFVQQSSISGAKVGPRTHGLHIAFSPDGNLFVLCGRGLPSVQSSGSGATIVTLHSPAKDFSRCCFSPTGKYVAGLSGATIYIWDITHTNTHLIETIVSDGGKISSLLYSSSIISVHSDGKVRFWQIGGDCTGPTKSTTTNEKPTALAAPTDITCLTIQSEDSAISVDSAGTVALWDLSNGLPKALLHTFQPTAHASSARLVDDILIIAFSESSRDWKISTWRIETGECIRTIFLSDTNGICGGNLTISGDGAILFAANPQVIRTWSALTGEAMGSASFLAPRLGLSPELDSPILVGSTVWYFWRQSQPDYGLLWPSLRFLESGLKRFVEGVDLKNLERCYPGSYEAHLALIEKQTTIADIFSGAEVFKLHGQFARPSIARWSGRYLIATYETGELLILDLVHLIQ